MVEPLVEIHRGEIGSVEENRNGLCRAIFGTTTNTNWIDGQVFKLLDVLFVGKLPNEAWINSLRKYADIKDDSNDRDPLCDFYFKDPKCVIPHLLELGYEPPRAIHIHVQTSANSDDVIFSETLRENVAAIFPSELMR